MLDVGVENMADPQQQQHDDRWRKQGQRNIPGLLYAPRPVHHRCLVQIRVNSGERGQINNHGPADFLPDAEADYHPHEITGLRQKRDRLHAEQAQHPIDDSFIGEQLGENAANDDPRQKVRHIQQRLRRALEPALADFIQQYGQQQRGREAEQDGIQSEFQRVFQHHHEFGILEHELEMLEADPFAMECACEHVVVLECDNIAGQRDIFEDEKMGERRQCEQQQHERIPRFGFSEQNNISFLEKKGPRAASARGPFSYVASTPAGLLISC